MLSYQLARGATIKELKIMFPYFIPVCFLEIPSFGDFRVGRKIRLNGLEFGEDNGPINTNAKYLN